VDWNRYLFNRLLIAIPDFALDNDFISFGRRTGIISEQEAMAYVAAAKRVRKIGKGISIGKSLRGKSLLQALMVLEPELISVTTIDFLRRSGLISVEEGHGLRAALKAYRILMPEVISDATLFSRLSALLGAVSSNEVVSLIRNLDDARIAELRSILLGSRSRLTSEDAATIRAMLEASIERAQKMRSAISLARRGSYTFSDILRITNIWNAITVGAEFLLSEETLKNAIRAGLIPREQYVLISALERLGLSAWKRGTKAFEYESWAARALLLSEGVLSTEMIDALRVAGIISPDLARHLYLAATAIRSITRGQMAKYMSPRRIRPRVGMTAIQSFARATNDTDRALLKLLAEASRDAEKEIARLLERPGIGARARRAQQALIRNALNRQMKELWEHVGYLTIFGERSAARSAIESMDFLQGHLLGRSDAIRRSILQQARAGIDSVASRSENMLDLSRSVYKNMGLTRGRVAREVQKAMLRGLGAGDIAKFVGEFINPNVRGGASYAAMRLARTEINNAFHWTSIRYTRDMPWVRGYQWHLSGSHPTVDVCNDMATRDHDNLGRGVYKKANVPGKPHPQCLCYITTVTDTAGVFEKGMRSGKYDQYLKQMERTGPIPDAYTNDLTSAISDLAVQGAKIGGRVLAARLLGAMAQEAAVAARVSVPETAGV
jgi:hypothetical protein